MRSTLVKTTIFTTRLEDVSEINAAYGEPLIEPYPARFTIDVPGLSKGALVEIEAIIALSDGD